jgi:ketosteroid isomerase-like protein
MRASKTIFNLLLSFVSVSLYAQHEVALKQLVQAEWSFINLAKETNTRDAFLAQLTDETIVFGEGPVIAKRVYENQQPNNGWLKWEPVFSDLARSDDFGYNTGPWEYRVNKTDEKAVAFGEFVSFWKKQVDGTWKLLIDIGIEHPQTAQIATWKSSEIDFEKVVGELKDIKQLEKIEQNFIEALAFAKSPAYQKMLSREARLYRPGKEPITDKEAIIKYINAELSITFTKAGQNLASSGDLGYVYGTAVVQHTGNQTKAANYLHVWKQEEGQGWKLVLDLVTYK